MEKHKETITIAFVLVIGLLGGYMIAEHTGAGGHHDGSHEEGHDHDDAQGTMPVQDRVSDDAVLIDQETGSGDGAGLQVQ